MTIISYYDPFSIFPLIKPSLDTKLPLTNLHWKLQDGLKSIPRLPINLVEEIPRKPVEALVKLMFINSTSLDTYKLQVRPLITEWLKGIEGCEWIVVMYSPIKKDKYSFKTSVFEKLRVDFGKDGKYSQNNQSEGERFFKLKEPNDSELTKLEVYNEFVNLVKEVLLISFKRQFDGINSKILESGERDLIYVNLLLRKSKYFRDLYLFKDALNVLLSLPDLLESIYHKNTSSFDLLLEVNYNDIPSTFTDIDVLKERNYFNIITNAYHGKFLLYLQLIENENLLSIQSLYTSNLLQELINYLNIVNSLFNWQALQFNYYLIEYYLNHPLIHKVLKTPVLEDINNSPLEEYLGEIELFQRSALVKIGSLKGYTIYEFQDIPLDKPQLKLEKTLDELFSSKERFFDVFEQITESIIQHFVNCDRTKTIDVLSIDLALLNYQKQNYKESLNILQDSYEFFLKNGWNYMGGVLLEIYVDCIEKLNINNSSLLVQSYIKLFANLKTVTRQIDINNYRLTRTQDQVSQLLKKIVDSSGSLVDSFEFPLDRVFDIKVPPYIKLDDSLFFIELQVGNLYEIDFSVSSIELELSKGLTFTAEDIIIPKDKNSCLKLRSTKSVLGFFRPVKLSLNLNPKLKLVLEFDPQVEVSKNSILNDSVVNNLNKVNLNTEIDLNTIYFARNEHVLHCDISFTPNLLLNSPSVVIDIHNGEHDAHDIGLSILTSENFTYKAHDLATKPILSSGKSQTTSVPIDLISDSKTITIKVLISYQIDGKSHEFIAEKQIDTNLEISVSVQDIFKSNCIFSRFQIGSVVPSPMRVISTGLEGSEEKVSKNYHVSIPRVTPRDCVVFGDQIYSSFYKIELEEIHLVKSSDLFKLSVEYSPIVGECRRLLLEIAQAAIKPYFFILKDLILSQVMFDFQLYLMENKLSILNVNELKHLTEAVSKFIPVDEKHQFIESLSKLLVSTYEVTIGEENYDVHTLNIYLPVSNIDILQTVEFKYEHKDQYKVGEPIPVELVIESTGKWSSKSKDLDVEPDFSINAESSILEDEPSLESFQISLSSDENWLISGFKRKTLNFDLRQNNSVNKLNLVLIPLAVGKLGLPKISIKLLNNKDLSMDISIKNGSSTILVVPELDRITFSF